ncbi:hypothetical protein C8T65DRAFT_87768 [Cerioporus squamosus]|nr:hypothetical protein C8T65DRAFT_87768 [Cerioporus squamosus]
MFFSRTGKALYFDKDGVRTSAIANVRFAREFSHILSDRKATPEARVWALVDSPLAKEPISPANHCLLPLFYVLFASKDQSRFKYFINHGARRWIMNPWEVEELLIISMIPDIMPTAGRPVDLERVQKLRSQYGPCPRDIASALVDSEKVEEDVQDAIESLSMDNIIKLVQDASTSPSIASDRLLLVQRANAIDPAVLLSDSFVTTFKTASVLDGIRARYKLLELEDALQHHLACGRCTVLAGIVFESLALTVLYRGRADFGCFVEYARMSPACALSAVPHCFEYRRARNSSSTLKITEHRAVQLVEGDTLSLLEPSFHESSIGSVPDIPRCPSSGIVMPRRSTLRPGSASCPRHPTILSSTLLLTPNSQSATLWIVQVAVHRAPAGAVAGFVAVKEIVKRAKRRFAQVDVKYLLIAPSLDDRMSVQWNMAKELGEVEGEVLVQFVGNYPCFSVEEIIQPGY